MLLATSHGLENFLPLFHSGKVRDTYNIPGYPNLLLQVASDRISTHNVVHESMIPQKGIILTALTVFWLRDILCDLPNHLEASGREIYRFLSEEIKKKYPQLHLRAIVVRQLKMVPVEFIFRRYLVGAGSLYRLYQHGEDPYGLKLPAELPIMHRFDSPVFTPTDKSDRDDPLTAIQVTWEYHRETQAFLTAFQYAESYLEKRGIALLDSKGECGVGGILADEIFTPDSSRFADLSAVKTGEDPPWLDKELVRTAAMKLWSGGPKTPLVFNDETISQTMAVYELILERITGTCLHLWVTHNKFDHRR